MPVKFSELFGGEGALGSPEPSALVNATGDPTDQRPAPALFWVALVAILAAIRLLWEYGEEV